MPAIIDRRMKTIKESSRTIGFYEFLSARSIEQQVAFVFFVNPTPLGDIE